MNVDSGPANRPRMISGTFFASPRQITSAMKGIITLAAIVLASFHVKADLAKFFSNADAFLKKHVAANGVNYKLIKKDRHEIDALYQQIGEANLGEVSAAEKKAFYINAYNLIVIHRIASKYPIGSPMDDPGFFDKVTHLVAGERLTLNQLEKEKLLKPYRDARVHFVLVCAAKSCPPLANFAMMPNEIDTQLNARTTKALNDPAWLIVNKAQGNVELSRIFEWYQADFGDSKEAVLQWINKFRSAKIPANYTVNYYEYDWALNDQ